MMESALLLIALSFTAYLGFALMALSQTRHWRQVAGPTPSSHGRVIALRLAGGATIALSLVLALIRDGPSFGALLWPTAISLAALTVALTLSWRLVWLAPLAMLATARRRKPPPSKPTV